MKFQGMPKPEKPVSLTENVKKKKVFEYMTYFIFKLEE